MKRLCAMFVILCLVLPITVFADTESVTINVTVSGVYQSVNHWANATYTFDVTDGVAASYGWLSNGEYSFKFYHADGVIKGGGNKTTAFSCDHVPETIVVPNVIGAINSNYFTYPERNIGLYASNDDQGIFISNGKANTTIVIPEGVTSIPSYIFAHNSGDNKKMNFVLPSTLKSIGRHAFSGFSSGGLYVDFVLPEGLEAIGNGAFSQCRYASITIPSTVTKIEDAAFTYNTKLKTVVFKGDVPSLGSNVFENCKELKSMTFEGVNAPQMNENTFKGFVDGYEFYVYYPYNGNGYDSDEWQSYFPPNTHFLMIDSNGNIIPEEKEESVYKADIDAMRLKWRQMLLAENADINDPNIAKNIESINDDAEKYWSSMNTSESRTNLWSGLSLTSERSLQSNYDRLYAMALAYSTKGCELYHNADMLDDIKSGMDLIYDNGYYSSTGGGSGNWWQWQIGIPQKIIRTCIVLYDELSDEQKDNYMSATRHFQNDITMTGANRMWECEVFIGRGIIEYNDANIQSAKEGISAVLGMVTGGDGYYSDGSFIQHTHFPYNGGYGQSLFANIAEMMYILNDSPWEITEAAASNMYNWVYNAYAPFIYKGQFMDMVRGREMARYGSDTYFIGTKVISAMVNITQYAPDRYADDIKSMIKYWYTENDAVDYYADMSNHSIILTKDIMNDNSIKPMEEPLMYRQFYNMDRAVQTRPGYGVGISMYSNRIGAYESINSENQNAHHTADGMIYLYNNDLLHYHNGFWPTVNLYRLSGTTVEKNTKISANTKGSSPWAGGVALNDKYGVTSMQLDTIGQSLEAKKSYFMFDDEIVCLGSDINSSDNIQVETIVENRKLSSANDVFTINGKEKTGEEEGFSSVNWASIEGEKADIGYYFPDGADIKALKENRKGNWSQVATATNNITYYADYATMWIEHGANPESESYQYVILPDKNASQTQSYTNNPDVEILANSSDVQAVVEKKNDITGVNFWTDGIKTAGGITSDAHGSVITQLEDGVLYVAVSDPAQTNGGWMNIEIDQCANRVITTDKNITIDQLSPTIKFSVYMGDKTGESFSAAFDISGEDNFDYGKDIYIIDNTDVGFTTDGSSWKVSTSGNHYYGENYLVDGNNNSDADRWAKWTPSIAETDEYDIYIRWAAASERPDNVPIEIAHADGVDKTKYINQDYNGSIWTYLGTYELKEGTDGYVKILATGVGNTCADTVMFVARNAEGNAPLVYYNLINDPVVNAVILDNGKVTAVNIQNAQNAGETADLLVAVYDGEVLEKVKTFKDIRTSEMITLTEQISYKEGNTIKAFLWDMNTFKPLAIINE